MHPLGKSGGSARRGVVRLLRRVRGPSLREHHALAGELRTAVARLADRIDLLEARARALDASRSDAAEQIGELTDLAAIESVTRWVRQAELRTDPLISVVLPTHRRADLLRRAIDSVLAQSYSNWELVVVEDGPDRESSEVVQAFGDPRIRWSAIPKGGVAPARNAALAAARGELIAYLDDDNTMDPDWLKAVAWAFEQRPVVQVLYGAFVIDDVLRVGGEASGELPRTFLNRFSREALRSRNVADMGAIAHRAGISDAWFDEDLQQMGDWDLLLRLTAERDPLVLPVIACYYTTDAPARLTLGPGHAEDLATIMARAEELARDA